MYRNEHRAFLMKSEIRLLDGLFNILFSSEAVYYDIMTSEIHVCDTQMWYTRRIVRIFAIPTWTHYEMGKV